MFGWVLNMPLLPVKNKETIALKLTKHKLKIKLKKHKTLWPIFRDGVQLSQSYRCTTRRHFTFYHSIPRSFWYLFN